MPPNILGNGVDCFQRGQDFDYEDYEPDPCSSDDQCRFAAGVLGCLHIEGGTRKRKKRSEGGYPLWV